MKKTVGCVLAILFITGLVFMAHKWKKGSDRAGCILNIRNVQQSVRSSQGMGNLGYGDPIDWEQLFLGPKGFMDEPACPSGGTYTFSRFHPETGVLACTCSLAKTHAHEPENYHDW